MNGKQTRPVALVIFIAVLLLAIGWWLCLNRRSGGHPRAMAWWTRTAWRSDGRAQRRGASRFTDPQPWPLLTLPRYYRIDRLWRGTGLPMFC
jgi:hypothetical protein